MALPQPEAMEGLPAVLCAQAAGDLSAPQGGPEVGWDDDPGGVGEAPSL